MAETDNQAAASVETRSDTQKSPTDFTKHWLQAIALAGTDEEDWRKEADDALKRFSTSRPKSFNILYANTQTTVPALYNSEPVPDVRRRFGDDDEVGERVAEVLERAVSIQAQMYDFDGCMKAAVRDRQLPGRGVTRVRIVQGQNGSKRVQCEQVVWNDFRRGPAKVWGDVPWTAFLHKMTREELVALSPKFGPDVELDAVAGDEAKKADNKTDLPDMFKRATVWEVWDKLERKVYWFAESFKDGPLSVIDDPYQLREFFCVPEPLYQVKRTDTLIPICEFTIWKPLADEVDSLTARIAGIVKVIKLRGLYDGTFAGIIEKMKGLDDGEMAAADDAARAMQQGGIEKAVWMWPVEVAIQVVQGLYEAREQAKNHLYELTGIADILRGQTSPSETLGAQQIKAQWGSMRLQEAQRDVQRFARDLFRLMADLTAYALEPAEIEAMVGMSLAFQPEQPSQEVMQAATQQGPQAVATLQAKALQDAQAKSAQAAKLLKSDLLREFAIDIETDSTIKADLTRAQENVAGFVTGLGTFAQSVVPMIEAQMMPPEVAMKFISAFSRNFKLGREADEAIDEWEKWLEDKAQQPPQPNPEQVKAQADQAQTQLKMAAQQQEMQAKAQDRADERAHKQALAAMDIEHKQAEIALKAKELEQKGQEIMLNAQAKQQEHGFKMQAMGEQAAFDQQQMAANAQHEDSRRAAEIQFLKQRQAAKPNGAAQ